MKSPRFALVALFLALGSFVRAAAPAAPEALEVEIMIYSGRPNPTFTITDPAEIREVLGAAQALPKAAQASGAAAHPKLGYQGIVVRNRSKEQPGIESIVVNRGAVQVKQAASAQRGAAQSSPDEARVDAANGLEQRLLAHAQNRGALTPQMVARIQAKR